MRAIILAAGFSTRMQASGVVTPKALLEIKGKLVIEHVLAQLNNLPIQTAIVTNNKDFKRIHTFVVSKKYHARVLNDGANSPENRLGAVRDIEFILDILGWDQDLAVFACDTVTSLSIHNFLVYCQKQDEVVNVVYDIGHKDPIKDKLGCLVTKDGFIEEFEEKPTNPKSTVTSVPYYYFPRTKLSLIKDFLVRGENGDSPGMLIQYLIKQKIKIRTIEIDTSGYYFDIRDNQAFEKLQTEVMHNRIKF
jgi:glucose-1-phosphate thymidylyltransferase